MFAIPGVLALLVLVYVRPAEFVPALGGLPLLELAAGLAVFGFVVDVRLGRSRLVAAPQLGLVALFALCCFPALVIRAPEGIGPALLVVAVSVGLFVLVAHAAQGFRALGWLGGAVLALGLVLAAVGVAQRFAPLGCIVVDQRHYDGSGAADGRPCETRADCEREDAEPGAEYLCEHVGLFGTSTVGGGRVRYRGHLNDPNELALTVGAALPLAFLLVERRRSAARIALAAAALVLGGACTIFTRSRGGQAVFLVVVGAYLVKRLGRAGVMLGAALALPIVLLGGRGGGEAEQSTLARTDAWSAGLEMVRSWPLTGVGQGQFTDHHLQTAHNAWLLAAAELGLPGLIAWSAILYLSFKIPIHVLRTEPPDNRVARAWAMALLASMSGLTVGMFFLSFTYHPVLWVYIGLTGAFAAAMRAHVPGWRVRLGWRDLAWVAGADAAVLAALYAWARLRPSLGS